jgi:hypothetical protein
MHRQSLGRANDRMLAALSAAMAMVRFERIVSSVDKTDRLTDLRTAMNGSGFSESETTVNTRLRIYILAIGL